MITKDSYRHGDVILIPVKIPKEAKERVLKEGKAVLALGEVTGHSHQINSKDVAMFDFNDKVYLRVTRGRAALTHEEHHRIDLPAGDYEVLIQREWQEDGWVKVLD